MDEREHTESSYFFSCCRTTETLPCPNPKPACGKPHVITSPKSSLLPCRCFSLCVTAVLGVLCSVLPNTATTLRASHSIISHRAPFPQFRDLCCRNAAEAELLSGYVGKFFHFCIPAMRRQNLRLPSSSRASPLFTHHLRASQAGAEQAYMSCQSLEPTSKGCGSCQPSAHVHGSHGVPDAILIRGVIQALHGAEAGAPVVAPDDVDSVVQRHRGHVAPLARDALGQQKATPRSKMGTTLAMETKHWLVSTAPSSSAALLGRGSLPQSTMELSDCACLPLLCLGLRTVSLSALKYFPLNVIYPVLLHDL